MQPRWCVHSSDLWARAKISSAGNRFLRFIKEKVFSILCLLNFFYSSSREIFLFYPSARYVSALDSSYYYAVLFNKFS